MHKYMHVHHVHNLFIVCMTLCVEVRFMFACSVVDRIARLEEALQATAQRSTNGLMLSCTAAIVSLRLISVDGFSPSLSTIFL